MSLVQRSATVPDLELQKMIDLKYQGKQIQHIQLNDLFTEAKGLLLKIYVITGWVVPAGDMKNILIGQLVPKLQESYGMLNIAEVEFAFRKAGTVIQDWGKDMNLALFDQVLIPYVNDRLKASEAEERSKGDEVYKTIFNDAGTLNKHRGIVEYKYQDFLKEPFIVKNEHTRRIISDVLELDGILKEGESIEVCFLRCMDAGIKSLYQYEK